MKMCNGCDVSYSAYCGASVTSFLGPFLQNLRPGDSVFFSNLRKSDGLLATVPMLLRRSLNLYLPIKEINVSPLKHFAGNFNSLLVIVLLF